MALGAEMPIHVLLADDSSIMLDALRKLLDEEPRIRVVGEANSFASTVQLLADKKPDILLLDLHMPQKRELNAALVKAQLSCVPYTIAISFANDEEAKSLAASYGAVGLLDKMSLYSQLLPAILRLSDPPQQPEQEQSSPDGFNLDLQTGTDGLSLSTE